MGTIVPTIIRRNCNRSRISGYCSMYQRGYVDDIKDSDAKTKKSFRKYWMSRYMNYIKNYQTTLDKNFPKTMHVYRIFSIGSKELYTELRRFINIRKKKKDAGIENLTREDLQLLHTFPKDLVKISPLLIISAIPFTNYVIFPMAFFFPRVLLTSHYWSLEQRLNFMLHYHKKRLRHNKPLLRCLQDRVDRIPNPLLKAKWSGVIACLGSGTHPAVSEIVSCIRLFEGHPYSLDSLTGKHTRELLAIHGIQRWTLNRKQKLMERGILIKYMDNAIKREGGVKKLPNDAIRWALSFRGVNPVNMAREDMQSWLENWLLISSQVEPRGISLLLHSPILLGYNYPTNWTLLYH